MYIVYIQYNNEEGDELNIHFNPKSDQPIYEQLKSEIIRLIMAKELEEGESLMSMRALAKMLGISVITTKRAYKDLEDLGYLYTIPGKGTFVSQGNIAMIEEQSNKELESLILSSIQLAKRLNFDKQDFIELTNDLWEE
ncbi:GntR family transcriptional regulator [Macrococcoides caseolyticum]|uniref:GntR family transcriptional regulator n=1 Tax=Macrococcoides caseolyticum TaxID=69966 RepID=UPI001F476818|nr:GntR family transcriptional regulator [Macrococcus caseolyticus]